MLVIVVNNRFFIEFGRVMFLIIIFDCHYNNYYLLCSLWKPFFLIHLPSIIYYSIEQLFNNQPLFLFNISDRNYNFWQFEVD